MYNLKVLYNPVETTSQGFFIYKKLKIMTHQKTISKTHLSNRIKKVPRSFIRDILSVANSPDIISFAGGLPNQDYFPLEEIKKCSLSVIERDAGMALQYSTSDGLPELKVKISEMYDKQGIAVDPQHILITTGSQQALDLIGKVLINQGDHVVIEEPAYLGAIQAFSMYEPVFRPVYLSEEGLDPGLFETELKNGANLAYIVPEFQNPTGITYSGSIKEETGRLAYKYNCLIIEDNPYGMIRFKGKTPRSLYHYSPEQTILLGTFSKTVAPGLRTGWMVIPEYLYSKFLIAKQAADLHTNIFSQRVINEFLDNYNLDNHLRKIINTYSLQADTMNLALNEYFPDEVNFTKPEGGMFTWVSMPEYSSSMELFNEAIKEKVAFVPGVPFYIDRNDSNTFRLNFSCPNPVQIQEGIKRLSVIVKSQIHKNLAV